MKQATATMRVIFEYQIKSVYENNASEADIVQDLRRDGIENHSLRIGNNEPKVGMKSIEIQEVS